MTVLEEATVGSSIRRRTVCLAVISLLLLTQVSSLGTLSALMPSPQPVEAGEVDFLLELPSDGPQCYTGSASVFKERVLERQSATVSKLLEMGIHVMEQHWLGNFIVARGPVSKVAEIPLELGHVRSYPVQSRTMTPFLRSSCCTWVA